MTESPSQAIVRAAQRTWEIHDSLGREIKGRALTVLDQARMFKAIGAQHSDNHAYVRLAMVAFSVTHVDGVLCPTPVSEHMVDAAIGRLGDDGYAAVHEMVEKLIAERQASDAAAGSPEALAIAKN